MGGYDGNDSRTRRKFTIMNFVIAVCGRWYFVAGVVFMRVQYNRAVELPGTENILCFLQEFL